MFTVAAVAALALVHAPGIAAAQGPVRAPGEPVATAAAVRAALEAGDVPGALALARSAAERHPDSPVVLVWLGHAERVSDNPGPAGIAYRRALRLAPGSVEAHVGLAEVLEATGNLGAAREAYESVLEAAPEAAAALRGAATLHMRAGSHARAAELLGRYAAVAPASDDDLYLLGMARYLSGDARGAIPVFEQILARAPEHVPAAYSLGVALADDPERQDEALDLLDQALAAGWEEANAAFLVGRIHADGGRIEAAIPVLERALAADPDLLDARYQLGQALARLGRGDEARVQMERFRELQQAFNEREAADKRLKILRNELAEQLAHSDLPAALATVGRMLDAFPDSHDVLVQAAKVWLSTGDLRGALDAATAARQLAGDDWEALYLEGLALLRLARPRDAVGPLQASLRTNPLFADTYDVLGNALLELGDAAGAIRAYLAAIDLDADNPAYYLNLATAYEAVGRGDLQAEALETYRRLTRGIRSER